MLVIFLISLIIILILFFVLKNDREEFESYSIDGMDYSLLNEVNIILKKVIVNINKNHNKNLIIGNIDRVEKTNKENSINYIINVFIYNKKNFTNINRKLTFDIDVTNNEIIVNNISKGFSKDIINFQRGGESTRGATLYKPNFDIMKIRGNENINLDYSNVDFNETKKKMVDRNSWILPTDIPENKLVIPTRKLIHVWDCNGIEVTSDTIEKIPILNHGMKPLVNIPDFIKYNFECKDSSSKNNWLFDLASDSASRPIGITGSTGTQ